MKKVSIYTDGACSGNPGKAAGALYWCITVQKKK